MLRYFFILLTIIFFISFACNNSGGNKEKLIPADVVNNPNTASGDADFDKLPKIEFYEEVHDFGNVIQGEKVTYGFKFKNVGKSDLVISRVSTSCGCAVGSYPKTPVKPGKEDVISVTFDSYKRKGFQNKTITIVSNTQPNKKIIRIKAIVINPEKL
jgi:hypothetical protein